MGTFSCYVLRVWPVVPMTAAVTVFQSRRAVVLTARIHPAETQASWMMRGILNFLTSSNRVAEVSVPCRTGGGSQVTDRDTDRRQSAGVCLIWQPPAFE